MLASQEIRLLMKWQGRVRRRHPWIQSEHWGDPKEHQGVVKGNVYQEYSHRWRSWESSQAVTGLRSGHGSIMLCCREDHSEAGVGPTNGSNTLQRHLTPLISAAKGLRCKKWGLKEESLPHALWECDTLASPQQRVLVKRTQTLRALERISSRLYRTCVKVQALGFLWAYFG